MGAGAGGLGATGPSAAARRLVPERHFRRNLHAAHRAEPAMGGKGLGVLKGGKLMML